MYAAHQGTERVATLVDGPVFPTSREGDHIPALDVVVTRSADGAALFLKTVNTDLERSIDVRVTIRGARVAGRATVERVAAESLAAVNGFATPDAVRTTRESIAAGSEFSLHMPRHSVAAIRLTVSR
jgi:alpha-L-arabinofuranosidase